jgi:hypothetical protein
VMRGEREMSQDSIAASRRLDLEFDSDALQRREGLKVDKTDQHIDVD